MYKTNIFVGAPFLHSPLNRHIQSSKSIIGTRVTTGHNFVAQTKFEKMECDTNLKDAQMQLSSSKQTQMQLKSNEVKCKHATTVFKQL